MSNREIVQQGLNARKDVRAAEARAEKYREDADAVRDNLFREQLSHKRARSEWQEEKAILTGIINRQNSTIVHLREYMAAAEDRARDARKRRILISAIKAIAAFVFLVNIHDTGWIVSWLTNSLTVLSLFCLGVSVFRLFRT